MEKKCKKHWWGYSHNWDNWDIYEEGNIIAESGKVGGKKDKNRKWRFNGLYLAPSSNNN